MQLIAFWASVTHDYMSISFYLEVLSLVVLAIGSLVLASSGALNGSSVLL